MNVKKSHVWQLMLIATLFFTVLAFTGCHKKSSDDGGGVTSSTTSSTSGTSDPGSPTGQANTALLNQDIASAKNHYLDALNADPNNKEANVGYAMTEGILLINDPAIVDLVNKMDTYMPTVQNVVYSAVTNSFQVWGGNTQYCGNDPAHNGYTKLTTTSTASPYTFNGPYNYYIVFTTPFSEITLDAVAPSSGNANGNSPLCVSGNAIGWDLGGAGDGKTAKLGGAGITGSTWIVKANPGSNSVTITTIGTSHATAPSLIAKAKSLAGAAPSQAGSADPLTQVANLMAKLPKNKPSLIQKAKQAFFAPPATMPSVSEIQAVLDTDVIPVLTDMIAKLRKVEGTGFTFIITPAMTGGTETVNTIIGDGELYALDTVISGLTSLLNVITAYNFDVDYSIIDADPLSVLNGKSSGLASTSSVAVDATKFFTLKAANGGTKMAAALTGLQEAADKAKLCYTTIYTEWGYTANGANLQPTQTFTDNRLMWHDPNNLANFTVADDTNNRNMLDAIKMALLKQVTLTDKIQGGTETTSLTDGTTTITLDSTTTTAAANTQTLVFDATKFFTSPVDRTDLPAMGYDLPLDAALSQHYGKPVNSLLNGSPVYCSFQFTTIFPDTTFNGIFPNGVPELGNSMQVINGQLEVSLDTNDMTRKIHLDVVNPDTVTSISAVVSVDGYSAYGTAPLARLRGVFYNDGTAGNTPGSNVGDIWAGMVMNNTQVSYKILRCMDATCDVSTSLTGTGTNTIMGTVSLHEQHTLSVAWDPTNKFFTFQLDSSPTVTVDPTTVNPSSPAPVAKSTANRSFKGVGVRINAVPGQNGSMLAHFDNVNVNGALYDDFSTFDKTKWLINQ